MIRFRYHLCSALLQATRTATIEGSFAAPTYAGSRHPTVLGLRSHVTCIGISHETVCVPQTETLLHSIMWRRPFSLACILYGRSYQTATQFFNAVPRDIECSSEDLRQIGRV